MSNEDRLQIEVVRYIQLQYPDAFFIHVPNGGKRNVIEAAKLKRMGVKAGVCDLIFFDVKLAIELKVGKNKPTSHQEEFISNLKRINWDVYVCYTFDEVKKIVDFYYKKY